MLNNSQYIYLVPYFMQIVNWKSHLKFPEEVRLSPEAKDLISKLLCNVNQRLGSNGADEIKVLSSVSFSKIIYIYIYGYRSYLFITFLIRLIHSSTVLNGINCIKWKLPLFPRSMMSQILKILKSLKRYKCLSNYFSFNFFIYPMLFT